MDLFAVKIGSTNAGRDMFSEDDLLSLGAASAQIVRLDADPGAVDVALAQLDGRRLLIEADLGGLNLVLHRLLRLGLLAETETAVVPRQPVRYLRRAGVPAERAAQLKVAVQAAARLVGVLKDDSGGVCLDSARLTPRPSQAADDLPARDRLPGRGRPAKPAWWVRAVVDDQRLCDGVVQELTVRRSGRAELEATVRVSRFRTRTCRGRSLQLACDPAQIVADGVARERPRSKRTFWSEPELWRLALPFAADRG